jgi:hypothetical protein
MNFSSREWFFVGVTQLPPAGGVVLLLSSFIFRPFARFPLQNKP